MLQDHTHGHVHQMTVVGQPSGLARPRDHTETCEVDTELALLTTIFQTGTSQLLTLVLLQFALFGHRVHHDLGGAHRVQRVGGRVEGAALLDRVEEVVGPGGHGGRGRQQDPQHAAQLLHVVQLEHLQLFLKTVFSHDNVDKLFLTGCTH